MQQIMPPLSRNLLRVLALCLLSLALCPASAWAIFLDEQREMSLSGVAYSRMTWALANDTIGTYKGSWARGNLVQHRNFASLTWHHTLDRLARQARLSSPLLAWLNLDAISYTLNARFEYDGVWDWGGSTAQRLRDGGRNHAAKYFGTRQQRYPGEFVRWSNFGYASSQRRIRNAVWNGRLYEAYIDLRKGPLFVRIGRQNLSWGETDVFRLLDQINPLDNNFGGFLTSLDERRIPLNMIRAQWHFGPVGPLDDLTLEGFWAVGDQTAAQQTLQGSFWTPATSTQPIALERTPCGGPFFSHAQTGSGQPCSVRPNGPTNSITDSTGGGRLVGVIGDYTFSFAHYYTWSDISYVRSTVVSPSPQHLLWDLHGLGNPDLLPASNPWGRNDPVAGTGSTPGTPGGILTANPAAIERNIRAAVNAKRIQISGASVSFPLSALINYVVPEDSRWYDLYTTFRAEFAYMRDVGVSRAFHDLNPDQAFQRYLTPTVAAAGVSQDEMAGLTGALGFNEAFLPGGAFSSEGGKRAGAVKEHDFYGWSIGLDHNQRIPWLNPSNSFFISAQLFRLRGLGVRNRFQRGQAPGLLNDTAALALSPRSGAPTGPTSDPRQLSRPGGPGSRTNPCSLPQGRSTPPCAFRGSLGFPAESQTFTLTVSSPYLRGTLTPRLLLLYDFAGSWLIQPGLDWAFWDPFRIQLRYNYLDGRYSGIGVFKTRDNFWLELQYVL